MHPAESDRTGSDRTGSDRSESDPTFDTGSDPTLDTLAAALRGRLIRPRDEQWDAARAAWNLAVDQRPAAVAAPRDAEDVRHILSAARAGGFEVAVQPRGHGASADLAGCILVRTSEFDEVSIDTDARIARVGAGVRCGTLLTHLDGTGLIALVGTSPDVSVAGFLLSGGHSWFSRRHGLAAHSIRAVELVDAQGELRRVTPESDSELMWALRGAGGLFGVVTTLEIELYEAPGLFGGKILFPGESAEAVFQGVAAVMKDAPDELSIFAGLINMPDIDMVPEPLRGRRFASADVVFVGSAEDGAALVAPLLVAAPVVADQTGTFPIGRLGDVSGDPGDPLGVLEWTAAVTELDDDDLTRLAEAFRTASAAGASMLEFRRLGGAIADPGADARGVAGHLESRYLIFAGAFLLGPPDAVDPVAVFEPFRAAVDGRTLPGTVPTFLTGDQDLSDAFPAQSCQRLAEIKRAVDPDNLIRGNRPLGRAYSRGTVRPGPTERSSDVT